jgi:hypothetical protein
MTNTKRNKKELLKFKQCLRDVDLAREEFKPRLRRR